MQQPQFQIRPFQPTDKAEVWLLHNEALEATGAHGGNGRWDDDVRDPDKVYLCRGGEFLVGILASRVVAMGALSPTSDQSAEIKRMRVSPQHQRRGFGARIMAALEHRALELGFQRLHLDTTVLQVAAQQFYLKHGYSEVGRSTLGSFEFIFYEKTLPSTRAV